MCRYAVFLVCTVCPESSATTETSKKMLKITTTAPPTGSLKACAHWRGLVRYQDHTQSDVTHGK